MLQLMSFVVPAWIHIRLSCLTPFGLMQISSRQICAGTQMPGKACKHYIHGVWIPEIHAGMTLLLKHLYNQETVCVLHRPVSVQHAFS
ncbi:MAG: hypothetical protein WCH01_17530 [Methylococcaceae bacterium]